jgi:hypothetical protein
MTQKLLNVGFGNRIVAESVVAIISPNSAPVKRMRTEAAEKGLLIDATQGRKTRSIIIMASNHVVLSAINPDTVSLRFAAINGQGLIDEE